MADEEHGAGVVAQQFFQQFLRVDVQIVGRLVQHQNVGGVGEQFGQQKAVALAAGKRRHGRLGAGGVEQEVFQIAHHVPFFAADFHIIVALAERVEHGVVFVQRAAELVEIRHFLLAAEADFAAGGREFAQNQLQKRGFADAVCAN